MTAWEDIQQDWAQKTEQGSVTGVLLWDLTAAFDTLDCEIICNKLKFYGFQVNSIKWFKSFLTGRSQMVKIGSAMTLEHCPRKSNTSYLHQYSKEGNKNICQDITHLESLTIDF